jgi:hypothetical protein
MYLGQHLSTHLPGFGESVRLKLSAGIDSPLTVAAGLRPAVEPGILPGGFRLDGPSASERQICPGFCQAARRRPLRPAGRRPLQWEAKRTGAGQRMLRYTQPLRASHILITCVRPT